jgi:hypothetical protein
MKTSADYNCLTPVGYFDKHRAGGITKFQLHSPYCASQCYGLGKLCPEYSIIYNRRVLFNNDITYIGSVIQ